jgi:Ras family protein A
LGTTLIDDQKDARLELWDTIGRSEDGGFVPLSDGDTDLVLICFSVDNPDSLDNALERVRTGALLQISSLHLSYCPQWVSDVAHYCPGTPYILVGCKLDLRSDPKTYSDLARLDQRPVTEEEVGLSLPESHLRFFSLGILQGKKMAHKIGAMEYVECSALTGEGVQLVFEQASKAALRYQIKRGRERRPRTVL